MSPADFRVRKMPERDCYVVWQRVGEGWDRLSDWYPTRAQARAAVDQFCPAGRGIDRE